MPDELNKKITHGYSGKYKVFISVYSKHLELYLV